MDKPKLNIIFDSRRQEKYEPLMAELATQKITDYEIWPCVMYPNVVASINASHKMIVRDAMERGLREVAIAEDDIFFPANDGWDYYLRNKPDEYDLYLACTYIVPVTNNKVCGFHLYMVHERFYEKFLSVPDEKHIDTAMDDLKGGYVFCYPFAALQRPGFSNNNRAVVNYNKILKPEDVYGEMPQWKAL
jgi:hypothetical protein